MTLSQWGELVLVAAALLVPPILFFRFRRALMAFAVGIVWVWGMFAACGVWLVTTDPEYDSIAPAMAIFFGWILGAVYCTPWLLGTWAIRAVRTWLAGVEGEPSPVNEDVPPDPGVDADPSA